MTIAATETSFERDVPAAVGLVLLASPPAIEQMDVLAARLP